MKSSSVKKPKRRTTAHEPPQLTQEEASLIVDAHDIRQFFGDEEEVDLMEQNNPALLGAYEKLRAIADGDDA